MSLKISLYELLILFGCLQGFVLGLVILYSKIFRSSANRFLAYTVLIGALLCTLRSFNSIGLKSAWLTLANDIVWELLFPVTFLFYFLWALAVPWKNSRNLYWLFAPFVLTLLINLWIDLDDDFNIINWNYLSYKKQIQLYYDIETLFSILFAIGISIWSYKIINQHRSKGENKWFFQFWSYTNIVIGLWVIFYVVDEFYGFDYSTIIWVGLTLLFFIITYKGLYQFKLATDKYEIREILTQKKLEAKLVDASIPRQSDYGEDNPSQLIYFDRLEQLMRKKHWYRNPDLSREIVAKALGISTGYLSQTINSISGKSFSDYINSYRVEEIKKMMLDPEFDHYSFLALGFEAGFNSKSTFYASFKKITGLTPSAFKKLTNAMV